MIETDDFDAMYDRYISAMADFDPAKWDEYLAATDDVEPEPVYEPPSPRRFGGTGVPARAMCEALWGEGIRWAGWYSPENLRAKWEEIMGRHARGSFRPKGRGGW